MSNPEHLDLVKQGADTWNRWYKEHYWGTTPDLRGADLSNIDLSDVRLSFARLEEACFSGSNLQHAYFVKSRLIHADLSHTNLRVAHLDRAWLLDANLQGAQLNAAKVRKASLARANLNEAVLSHVNLEKTYLYEATTGELITIHDKLLLLLSTSSPGWRDSVLPYLLKEARVKAYWESPSWESSSILRLISLDNTLQAKRAALLGPYWRITWPHSEFSGWHKRETYQKALSCLWWDLRHESNQGNKEELPPT